MNKAKRILICAAGGSPSTNFVRSLRMMKEKVFLVGIDCDPFTLQRSETDIKVLVPKASTKNYLKVLNSIIKEYKIDFIHAQNDVELEFISENREKINTKVFMPKKETVQICVDKFKSYSAWEKAGIKVPKTIFINNQNDLKKSFKELGPRIWLRDIKGAAGKGALPTSDYKEGLEWIQRENGWGHFTAAECLTKDTVTWMSIWKNGELVVAQARKRLSWELGSRSPSGVTGVTGTGETYKSVELDKIAIATIKAIDNNPDGIFSVDCTYDQKGVPNPTEINIARFFTTHLFFTVAGLNMPEIYLKLAFNEKLPKIKAKLNPLKSGLLWVRGVDFLPIIVDKKVVEKSIKDLDKRLKKVK